MTGEELKKYIRNVPDFPKKGIVFRDITTLLLDGYAFHCSINLFLEELKDKQFDKIAAIESRGFILGGALANRLQKGLILIRKQGKLPAKTIKEEYKLEYGTDAVEIHEDAIQKDDKVVIIDDLLATGGTALSSCRLIEKLGGKIESVLFLIELSFLKGREKLQGYPINSFINYTSE
ncbi:adenine phosphoribosyltransferase [candidate division WOR-3 bacterium]|nr:adenine phosphoribosyltransferase [candidate division WOR-3 bacterium]MCK4576358.1 adenine phosphoribosyltransferase [candidate division WOR-3 bacterium]